MTVTHVHEHEHEHYGHGHADHGPHDHSLAPSGRGTVMLDIGADIGAIVIHTAPRWHGLEIEVSPVAPNAPRKHAAVRARHVSNGVFYSAVIDGLPEGRYVVWRDADTPADRVVVTGGSVTEYDWLD
jgi:hypothetical protein